MLGGLAAYLLNFLAGKNKNSKLAQSWLAAHRQLLEDNFSVIGQHCAALTTSLTVSFPHFSECGKMSNSAPYWSNSPFIIL